MVSDGIRAVNLGSGTTVAPGWINIDNSPNARLAKLPFARQVLHRLGLLSAAHLAVTWPDGLIVRDIRRRLPFANRSVQYVFTSHTFEHLSRAEALRVLADVRRVLNPGGVVRVVVPDLRAQATAYVQSAPDCPEAAETFLHTLRLSRGGRDPHKWMYDAASLPALLTEAGFADARTYPGGEGRVPDLDILDARREGSVHAEGVRPHDGAHG